MATKNLGLVTAIKKGNTEPSNKNILWFDDRLGEKVLKYYNSTSDIWLSLNTLTDLKKILYNSEGKITVNSSDDVNSDDSDTMASTALAKKKANLEGGNTFEGNQNINGDVKVLGGMDIGGTLTYKKYEDITISDNVIELNVGESGAGVSARYMGVQGWRGTLPNIGLVFDEQDDTLKFGLFETISGKIISATGTTVKLDDNASLENGFYNDKIIKFFKISELSKSAIITNYIGSDRIATLDSNIQEIDNTWGYRILVSETLYPIIDLNGQLVSGQFAKLEGSPTQDFAAKKFSEGGIDIENKYAKISGDRTKDFVANNMDISGDYTKNGSPLSFDIGDISGGLSQSQIQELINNSKVVISNETESVKTISPNIFYKWGKMELLNITLAESSGYAEYMFEFVSGPTKTKLNLPYGVKQIGVEIEANMICQVSIVNNLAVVGGWS